jgi:hypothetical protein
LENPPPKPLPLNVSSPNCQFNSKLLAEEVPRAVWVDIEMANRQVHRPHQPPAAGGSDIDNGTMRTTTTGSKRFDSYKTAGSFYDAGGDWE